MVNLINRETTKEAVLNDYKGYQDVWKQGIEPFHRARIDPIFCEIPEGAKVLDVGCNSGEFMLMCQTKGCDVTGVDVAPEIIEKAKAKGLNVLEADAENLPFPDATFDVLVCMEVLIHLHDPVKALKEFRRVLKPSGVLLGSAPHANLERHFWEEKRLHRRYYDEGSLYHDLSESFDRSYIKVLNGAQFSLALATSMLSGKPAEMLFKCGGEDCQKWEHGLWSDTKTLRVWMGPTQTTGDVYYRMTGFGEKMRSLKDTDIAFNPFDYRLNDSASSWQTQMCRNPKTGLPMSTVAMDQLEKCLRAANLWVFQVTYYKDVLAFLKCAKDLIGRPLVTEMDDWLFDLPSYNLASNPYKRNSEQEWTADQQIELSDALIVSTSFLKEKLEERYPGKKIHVVPNGIDFNLWDNAEPHKYPPKDGKIRIGYTGCGNHSGDVEIVKEPLKAILDEFPNVEVLFPVQFDSLKDFNHERVHYLNQWADILTYPGMVKGWDLDIGIAPLKDHVFNRAKSNLRWLEYSAMRIPTVASNVRPFAESIKNKATGFLCNSKKDWYESLRLLVTDQAARMLVGEQARADVFERFNMDKIAADYRNVLQGIKDDSLKPAS